MAVPQLKKLFQNNNHQNAPLWAPAAMLCMGFAFGPLFSDAKDVKASEKKTPHSASYNADDEKTTAETGKKAENTIFTVATETPSLP